MYTLPDGKPGVDRGIRITEVATEGFSLTGRHSIETIMVIDRFHPAQWPEATPCASLIDALLSTPYVRWGSFQNCGCAARAAFECSTLWIPITN